MKLHLPKALLTAVLAMCVAQDAWADWAPSDKYSDTDKGKIVFYTTTELTVVDKFNPSTGNEIATSCTNIWIAPESNNQEHVFTNVYIADDDTLSIVRNPWGPSDNAAIRDFKSLTIESLKIGDGTGAATLIVNTNQNLTLNELKGSIKTMTVDGTMTVGFDYEFSSAGKVTGNGTLIVADGANVTMSSSGASAAIQSAVKVLGGAKLTANGNDKLGWSTTGSTKSITLEGSSADKKAFLELGGRQTMVTELHMDGYAEVKAYQNQNLADDNQAGLNAYRKNGAIIDVSGTNNVISAALHTRDSFHITVAKDGELQVSGQVRNASNGTNGYDDNPNGYSVGSIVKLGEGKITFSHESNVFEQKYFQEAGETVIAATAEFKNGIKIKGGEFTLDADVTLGKAIELAGGSLDLGESRVILVSSLDGFSCQNIATNLDADENGFAVLDKIYTIIDGVTAANVSGNAIIKLNSSDSGQQLSATGTYTVFGTDITTTYAINIGEVSTSSTDIAGATGFVVNAHEGQTAGNLKIVGDVGTLTAAQILTGTTGSGNITIGTNITLGNNTATQVTGGLTIESGKTLQVGNGTGHSSTIASFSSVKLDGGTLRFHNNGSTVHNLTVSQESTLRVQDMNAAGSIILLDDTTTLDAKLNVTSGFKGTLQIAKLTGTGDLDIKAGNNGYNDTLRVNIDALDSYTGKISYTASAWGSGPKTHNILTIKSEKDFALSGLNVLAGKDGENYTTASAVIEAKGKADLGDVKVTNGSSVTLRRNNGRFYVVMDSLAVEGSATIQTADGEASNKSYETEFSIGKLVGTDATLKLRSGSNTGAATVFNLNGGEGSNFSGAIEVGGYNNGDECKAVLNINDSTIASNAEIRFNAENDKNTAYLALGADNVAVKGISDVAGAAQIVSGEVAVGTTDVKSDDTVRTLTINTQGNSYSTAAKIDKNINLVKSGEGTQTFSGDVSEFNGSVTVKEGELALTGTSTLSLNQLSLFDTTNATGGTLSVGSANGGTVSIVSAGDKVGSVVVGKGSVLNGNLTLGAGTALTLNGYGDNAATINGTLTLGTGMQVSGLEQLLNDLAAQEAGTDGLKSLKLFNVTEVDFGTVEATLAMAADALVEEQPLIAGYDASNYFSTLSVGEYALVFQNSALYIQATAPIPEPTTATLSLLALTALAARRRRK